MSKSRSKLSCLLMDVDLFSDPKIQVLERDMGAEGVVALFKLWLAIARTSGGVLTENFSRVALREYGEKAALFLDYFISVKLLIKTKEGHSHPRILKEQEKLAKRQASWRKSKFHVEPTRSPRGLHDDSLESSKEEEEEEEEEKEKEKEEEKEQEKETTPEPTKPPPAPKPKLDTTLPVELSAASGAWAEWLTYKRGKGQGYKSKGSLTRIFRDFPTAELLTAAIDNSIKNNYQGLFAPTAPRAAPTTAARQMTWKEREDLEFAETQKRMLAKYGGAET